MACLVPEKSRWKTDLCLASISILTETPEAEQLPKRHLLPGAICDIGGHSTTLPNATKALHLQGDFQGFLWSLVEMEKGSLVSEESVDLLQTLMLRTNGAFCGNDFKHPY